MHPGGYFVNLVLVMLVYPYYCPEKSSYFDRSGELESGHIRHFRSYLL